MCLLLRQHIGLFRVAAQRQLDQSEDVFGVAANSFENVYKVMSTRYLDLVGKCSRHIRISI